MQTTAVELIGGPLDGQHLVVSTMCATLRVPCMTGGWFQNGDGEVRPGFGTICYAIDHAARVGRYVGGA